MVLDWNTLSGENIYGTNIYGTNITWTNIKGTNITWNKIYSQSGLFSQYCNDDGDNCSSIEDLKLWSKNNEDIYYTSGNVWIWDTNPTEKLVVEGSIKTSKVKNNNNSYIELFLNKLDFVSNELVFRSPNWTQEEKVIIKWWKVWIWTNNPSEKLEVNGTGNFSGNISAKNGYFSGMEIKGGNVKSLSSISQKAFNWIYPTTDYIIYLPAGTLVWTQNNPLPTDSKRYISCITTPVINSTGAFLLLAYNTGNVEYSGLEEDPNLYAIMPFYDNVYYELKAGETFAIQSMCKDKMVLVSKQEYWWNITPR